MSRKANFDFLYVLSTQLNDMVYTKPLRWLWYCFFRWTLWLVDYVLVTLWKIEHEKLLEPESKFWVQMIVILYRKYRKFQFPVAQKVFKVSIGVEVGVRTNFCLSILWDVHYQYQK